jgi:hypothetical protein
MTAVAEKVSAPTRRPWIRREAQWLLPTAVGALDALVFAIVAPNVNDIFAATARASAVLHGVGLDYWFGWFGGGSTPGNYSVLTPYLSALLTAIGVAAVATAATTPVAWLALRGTRHAGAAVWIVVITAGLNLWSGRVPFALGCLMAVAAAAAITRRRPWLAALFGLLTVASSPVSGAFLALLLAAVLLTRPDWRRTSALALLPIAAGLVGVAILFGQPGPESFTALQLAQLMVAAAAMLVVTTSDWLRSALWLTLLGAPLVFLVPNGMGDNLLRLVAYCLPAVVLATSMRPLRTALLGISIALLLSTKQSVGDVFNAAEPTASPGYYRSLADHLEQMRPQLSDCRLEVVDDGTHTAAYALLDDAMLARGYEYQEDNALNAVLATSDLDAVQYKLWLDNNAVCYVAIARTHRGKIKPEYRLVASQRPDYLTPSWSDPSWTVYRVVDPTAIVAPPVRVLRFSQSKLVLRVPCACTFGVRVRKPQHLKATTTPPPGSGRARLHARVAPDGFGWTTMTTPAAGIYTLTG